MIDLVDVLDGDRGKNYPTSDDFDISGHTLFLNASNVTNDGFLFQDNQFITEEKSNSMGNGKLEEDDIVVTSRGSLGHIAWYNADISSLVPYARINSGMLILRNKKEIETEYLYHFMKSSKGQSQISFISFGSAQPQLTKKGVEALEVILPTRRDEQVQLGHYFSDLDHLITLHQRKYINGKKEELLAWEQRKFSDCYKMSSGYAFKMSDYCDEGVGLINGESIQHGIINDDNLNHLPESFVQHYPEFLLKENDIVVGLNRPITNGNLKIARIPSKYNDSLLYQRAGKIVYKTDCDKDFTYVLLSQEILKHTLVEAVGSDQPFISTSKLDGWKMMMPSDMEEQVKIGEYFQNLDHLITLHKHKCEELQNIKKFMLQNMFI